MRVISWTRVLALFVVFSLFACSPEEVHRPDTGENPEEGIRVGGGGDLPDVVHDVAHVLGTPGAAS